MVKSKRKKKKDVDFQKVKLKVGRKLKRDLNETKAEFKARKIVLKEVRSYSENPILAIVRHSDNISHHGKLTMLNHFNSALTPEVAKSLNKPIIDSLSKFIIDHSEQVRAVAFKCLKTCYNQLKHQSAPTKDFVMALKPYLDCAYTHVSAAIVTDCQNFLSYLVNLNDPQLFECLMAVFLRRLEAGNFSHKEKQIAALLRYYYVRQQQKQRVDAIVRGDRMEPLVWTEANFLLDLDRDIHELPKDAKLGALDNEIRIGLVQKSENVAEKFLELVKEESTDQSSNTKGADEAINGSRPVKRFKRF